MSAESRRAEEETSADGRRASGPGSDGPPERSDATRGGTDGAESARPDPSAGSGTGAGSPAVSPPARLLIELGPLLVFLGVLFLFGIFPATGALMAAMVVSLGLSWKLERRVPPMTIVTAVLVLVLGGLTLWLGDETFIKLKPTIVSLLFAATLAVGLVLKRPLLSVVFATAFRLTDEGWRLLTVRWIGFFVFLAALNELVWRTTSTKTWATFKVFGVLGLTIAFTFLQMSLIQRHQVAEEEP